MMLLNSVERFSKYITVGTEWEEYSVTDTVLEDTQASVRFTNWESPGVGGGDASYWVDSVRFYEGKYVPTEIDSGKAVAAPRDKLTTTWGGVKARY